MILHSYLCNALFKFFIKIENNVFPKHTLKSKAREEIKSSKEEIVLSRDSKELFGQRFVEVFHQNRKHVETRNQRTGTPADFTVPW